MLNRSFSAGSWVAGAFLAITAMLSGCDHKVTPQTAPPPAPTTANNLKFVKCQKQSGGSGPVIIPINSTDYGIARDYQIVFVCDGETVRWDSTADPNVTAFTITFKNGMWPFGQAPNNPPAPLTSTAGVTQDEKVIGPTKKYAQDYEYTLDVQRKNGNPVSIDPHIIPMGP